MGFHFLELLYVRVEVATFLFQVSDMMPAATQQLAQLLHAGPVDLVEVEQLPNLIELEAEPLTTAKPK